MTKLVLILTLLQFPLSIFCEPAVKYKQVLILAGDKHRTTAFTPLLKKHTTNNTELRFYGMNVNPNRGNHIQDLKNIQNIISESFNDDKEILVLSWSIASKLVVDLLDSSPNIKKVIMFDPMDGSPPLSKTSDLRPETTNKELPRLDVEVLILKAELSHRSNFIFKAICDRKPHEFEKFTTQYDVVNPQVHVIKGAGHLQLIYGPFGILAHLACRSGPKKKAIVLYEVKSIIHDFLDNKDTSSHVFEGCDDLKHGERKSRNRYCVDGEVKDRKFLKNVTNRSDGK